LQRSLTKKKNMYFFSEAKKVQSAQCKDKMFSIHITIGVK